VLTFLFPVAWGLKGVYDGGLPEGASERLFERSRSISSKACRASSILLEHTTGIRGVRNINNVL
jgi:hypothetical protein